MIDFHTSTTFGKWEYVREVDIAEVECVQLFIHRNDGIRLMIMDPYGYIDIRYPFLIEYDNELVTIDQLSDLKPWVSRMPPIIDHILHSVHVDSNQRLITISSRGTKIVSGANSDGGNQCWVMGRRI